MVKVRLVSLSIFTSLWCRDYTRAERTEAEGT